MIRFHQTFKLAAHAFPLFLPEAARWRRPAGAHVHHGEAGRRAPRAGRGDHPALRAARLQAGGHQVRAGDRGPPADALRGPVRAAVLPRSGAVHGVGACGADGVRGQRRGAHGPHDAGRHQPEGVRPRHHPRRLLCGHREERLPRVGRGGVGQEGDRAVVQTRGARGVGAERGRVGV